MHGDHDLRSGDILGGFKIEKVLGRGGMGTVFMAHDLGLNRKVALKVIAAELSGNAEFLMRFRREAQVIASLKHPHIVNILSYGQEKGHHFFAMEYVHGQDLREVLQKRRSLPCEEALGIIRQVADALSEAAAKGVVHRDIKPSNIMIDSVGRAYVTDFGVACFEQASAKLTHTGMFVGTPEYASPEQAKGLALDIRSDIYSLGGVLYRMLTGQPPVSAESPLAVMVKICSEPVKPIAQIDPSIPEPICALVDKMMAKELQQRYPSPSSLLEDIDRRLRRLRDNDDPFASLPQERLNFKAGAKGTTWKQHRTVRPKIIGILGVAAFVLSVVFWIVWLIGKDSFIDVDEQHLAPQAHVEAPAASYLESIDLDPNAERSTGSHEIATQTPALSASTPVQEKNSSIVPDSAPKLKEAELQKVAAISPVAPSEILPATTAPVANAKTGTPPGKARRVEPKPAALPQPEVPEQSKPSVVKPSEHVTPAKSTSSPPEPSSHITDHAVIHPAPVALPPPSESVEEPIKIPLRVDPVLMVVAACEDKEIEDLIRYYLQRRFRDSGFKTIHSTEQMVRDNRRVVYWSDVARGVTPGLADILILVDAYPPSVYDTLVNLRFCTQVADIKNNKLISYFLEPLEVNKLTNMNYRLKSVIDSATVDLEIKIRKHWDEKRHAASSGH